MKSQKFTATGPDGAFDAGARSMAARVAASSATIQSDREAWSAMLPGWT
jgi:hypothetical protein